jgi:hypothetical protein
VEDSSSLPAWPAWALAQTFAVQNTRENNGKRIAFLDRLFVPICGCVDLGAEEVVPDSAPQRDGSISHLRDQIGTAELIGVSLAQSIDVISPVSNRNFRSVMITTAPPSVDAPPPNYFGTLFDLTSTTCFDHSGAQTACPSDSGPATELVGMVGSEPEPSAGTVHTLLPRFPNSASALAAATWRTNATVNPLGLHVGERSAVVWRSLQKERHESTGGPDLRSQFKC